MKRRWPWGVIALLLAWSAIFGFTAGAARADMYSFRWAKGTVCVEMHASTHYPVKAAVHAWDAAPGVHLTYQHDCSGYSQKVRVYSGWYGKTGWAGQAMLRWSDGRLISPLWIKLNNSYAWNYSWTGRAHIVSHEIGHTLGEAHTTHWRSVMRPGAYEYAYPQPYDLDEIGDAY
jgi:hypothetical protein